MNRGFYNDLSCREANIKRRLEQHEIGAVTAPLCMASAPDAFTGRPADGSSDQFDPQNAGWAPDDLTLTFLAA